ncbi:hypothetical protein Q9L58_004452 [Maublancomyces gigas]|uniref:Fungal N-terminal domain-containing protein n=1 Tax=Discina gigas TaxID=1032678 RepID=A0ABR3GL04_9PEZI
MEGVAFAISLISTCIDLAQSIDSLIQKFKHARSEFQEGLRIVTSTRRLLTQFRDMFETSCLPHELLEDYSDDLRPLQSELETIQRFLNTYLPLCSRGGLAGLAWRYRWGKEIEKHQKNLVQLNRHLNSTLATLSFKVGFLALEAIHVGSPVQGEELGGVLRPISQRALTMELSSYRPVGRPPSYDSSQRKSGVEARRSMRSRSRFSRSSSAKDLLPPAIIEETLLSIGRKYLEAAQDLRSRESQYEPPLNQIQYTYNKAAKALQVEEWSGPFCSPQISLVVEGVM